MTTLFLFATLILMLALGIPIAVSLGLSALGALMLFSDFPIAIVGQKAATNIAHFPLMAIPFFILASNIMNAGGITRRLIDFSLALVGHLPGGLAIAGILSCMFFAAISGSSSATVVAIGSIMIPAMIDAGYDRRFAVGTMATAGALGILIPPSIAMIIFGFVTQTSVPKLFMAGILPGLLLGLSLIVTSFVIALRRGFPMQPRARWKHRWKTFRQAFVALLIPVFILGGIYGLPRDISIGPLHLQAGAIFTPTEAAVVAVFMALVSSIYIYRGLRWRDLPGLLVNSGTQIGMLLFIILNATFFGFFLSNEGIPQLLADHIVGLGLSPWMFLLTVNVVLFFAGDFMDATPIILIFVPILFPAAMALGIDPLHFGIMVVVNMELGAITPPVGMNLYMASVVSGMPLYDVMRAALPWMLVMVAVLLLITYIPWISVIVPQLYYGG